MDEIKSLLDLLTEEKKALDELKSILKSNETTKVYMSPEQAERRLTNARLDIRYYFQALGFVIEEEK